MSAWTEHVERWKDCTNCPLCEQRDYICLARGTVPAPVVFIGEAPGASEDTLGQPFVGPAGCLLDQIIEHALPSTVKYALTNLVCCFPREAKARGENEPELEEITACRPRLVEFVRLCRPRLIVLVGQLARRSVHGAAMFRLDGMGEQPEWIMDGSYLEFIDIVHPAAILRMPLAQRQMAVQKSIVVLRNAVENMLGSSQRNFTNRGKQHASRTPLPTTRNDANIPF